MSFHGQFCHTVANTPGKRLCSYDALIRALPREETCAVRQTVPNLPDAAVVAQLVSVREGIGLVWKARALGTAHGRNPLPFSVRAA